MEFKTFFAAVAALLATAAVSAATIYPLGFSINGTPFDRDDIQLPESAQSVYGIRLGLARAGHAEMAGFAIAVGANRDKFAGGLQFAALGRNSADNADWGLWQISVFGNKLDGDGGVFQLSAANDIDGRAEGCQVGLFDFAVGQYSGVQLGALNDNGEGKPCDFSGLQLGCFNFNNGPFSGVQIGAVNKVSGGHAASFGGIQIGVINYIECPPSNFKGVQIGVANITSGPDWVVGFIPGLRVVF